MSKISRAVQEIHRIDMEAGEGKWINNIHPLAKVITTIFYIVMLVSFDKYNLSGILAMIIYPLIIILVHDISIKKCMGRIWGLLILICAVGIINPFIDKRAVGEFLGITITSGMISMITLCLKGVFAVVAVYILIITTSIEKICYALRTLHVPKIFVTLILLIYRYIIVLMKEAEKMTNAYKLRAPGEKGIKFKVWGSLVGLLMLRSMDRAENVYESMSLRGYHGEYFVSLENKYLIQSILYFGIWIIVITTFRIVPIFKVVGNMFL